MKSTSDQLADDNLKQLKESLQEALSDTQSLQEHYLEGSNLALRQMEVRIEEVLSIYNDWFNESSSKR